MLGFDSTKSALHNSYQNNKLHHAILFNGKKGIGKASFAKSFANQLLQEHSTTSSNHPDLLIIEKEADKREITVDKIRKIADFINQTSAISKEKFIIIDSASELNKSAANALLKILEEPHPNNFLFLISHNISRVLPTIRSRCFITEIADLSFENFAAILQQKNSNITNNELKFLSDICDNSPAEAINLGSDLIKFYALFLQSLKQEKLQEDLLKKISDKNFNFVIFEKIFYFFINRLLQLQNNLKLDFYLTEQETFSKILDQFNIEKIFKITEKHQNALAKTNSLYLDKKLTLINIFNEFYL